MNRKPPTHHADIPTTQSSSRDHRSTRRGRKVLLISVGLLAALLIVSAWVVLTSQRNSVNQSAQATIPHTLTPSPTLIPSPIPQVQPPRTDSALAYDPDHHIGLLFGGMMQGVQTNETWAWNGHAWTQLHSASSPPALQGIMAYDGTSQRIILLLNQVQSGGTVAN